MRWSVFVCCFVAEVRCAESSKIRGKYQDRIPVSVVAANCSSFSIGVLSDPYHPIVITVLEY